MADRPRGPAGQFVDRLGELVLLSFAAGQDVEGTWALVNDDRMVPDLYVSIDQLGDGRDAPLREPALTGTDVRDFESKLQSFLLREFSEGETVAGTWELRFARAELPAWRVAVELDGAKDEPLPDESTPDTA